MKKSFSNTSSGHSKEITVKSLNIAPLNISSINSNATLSTHPDTQLRTSVSSSGPSSYSSYQQICSEVTQTFLDIRRMTLDESPNAALLLRKTVPIDADEKSISMIDPLALLLYIKQMFTLVSQMKNEVERELSEKKENECSDYEGMLQKLEAEVRQHIRIEQQLKLYIESTQSKLDEVEKNKEEFNSEAMQAQIEKLKAENANLAERLKKRDVETESLRKDLKTKIDHAHSLELQVDTIPILKNKIKELEKITNNHDFSRTSATINFKTLNTSTDNNCRPVTSTSGYAQHCTSSSNAPIDLRARKNSQQINPNHLLAAQDGSKFKSLLMEKNKENIENLKIDISKKSKVTSSREKSNSSQYIKENTERPSQKSSNTSLYEVLTDQTNFKHTQSTRSDVHYEEDSVKARKSVSNRQDLRADARNSVKERLSYNDREGADDRSYSIKLGKQYTDENESSNHRTSVDRSRIVSRQKDLEEEFERLQHKVKRNISQDRNSTEGQSVPQSSKRTDRSSNDNSDPYNDYNAMKKAIPKPNKTNTQVSEGTVYLKKDHSTSEINKLKVSSDSRSQSVDATNKYYRALKTKVDNTDKSSDRNDRDRSEYLSSKVAGGSMSNAYQGQASSKPQGYLGNTQNLANFLRVSNQAN